MDLDPIHVIHAWVDGPYGYVLEKNNSKRLYIYYQGGSSNGTQGEYLKGEDWAPISETGT